MERNMWNTRRLGMIGLSVVATGALFAGTAAADPAASAYEGSAKADALTISLFGQTITTSAATAQLNAALAKATATQTLTPGLTDTRTAEAHVGETKDDKPATCTGSQLTAVPGIHRSDITCGSAHAALTADGGEARGLGAEVALEPSASGVLSTLQLQEPVQQGADQLFSDAINPLVKGLTGNPVGDLVSDASTSLQDVLNKVLSLTTTARIVVAPALAEVSAQGNTVTSHARAQGVRIELLPVAADAATNGLLPADLAPGEPLVTITIGNAEATKTVTKDGTGKADSTSQAALVTVKFGSTALTDALGLSKDPITVAGGQSFCVPGLVGTPLETCITVANAGVDADGNPFADGASVQLFKGVNGGIDIATGRASTGGAAFTAAAAQLPASGDLPRTGGNATLPLVGGAILGLAVFARRLSLGHR
jgi:hypothetical protein